MTKAVTQTNSRFPTRNPLAWHITFGTYGTRLHGDPRGSVDRRRNHPGTSIEPTDPRRVAFNQHRLAGNEVKLTAPQREWIEQHLAIICDELDMDPRACAAAPDHVHVVVRIRPGVDGKTAMSLLKRHPTQGLNSAFGRLPARWWAEGGSTIPILSPEYLENAIRYVNAQSSASLLERRTTRLRSPRPVH